MKKITINNQEFKLVSSYEEMNKLQLLQTCNILAKNNEAKISNINLQAMRISFFRVLTDISESLFNKITAEQFADLLPHIDFVFEAPNFSKNPFPKLKIGFKELHGPVGLMEKCTADEFIHLESEFLNASNNKNIESMKKMFVILYRPQRINLREFKVSDDWNGDYREPFNYEKCLERLQDLNKIPDYYFIYAFLLFKSVRKQRFERLKYLFVKTESTLKLDYRGWAGQILELSHTGAFGSLDELVKQNWFTVMFELDRLSEINYKSNEKK